ncbi:MAG: hypothetical protein V2J42_05245 [Wenzhouxiangella sp.]|jgi:hypothetical protein|nr:hypothetical protein [Wenzhouxiangella sp.]
MTSKFVFLVSALALLLVLTLEARANEFSTLEERMTGREFRDAGLHKLTEEELESLNRWIQLRSLAAGEVPAWATRAAASSPATSPSGLAAAGDNRGLPGSTDRTEISSRLMGTFSGWSGDDVFELENGMIWQQADGGRFSVPPMENPEVRIMPGMFGSWQLQLEGYNTRIRVRRIQ